MSKQASGLIHFSVKTTRIFDTCAHRDVRKISGHRNRGDGYVGSREQSGV